LGILIANADIPGVTLDGEVRPVLTRAELARNIELIRDAVVFEDQP